MEYGPHCRDVGAGRVDSEDYENALFLGHHSNLLLC